MNKLGYNPVAARLMAHRMATRRTSVKTYEWATTPESQKVYIGRTFGGHKDCGWGNPYHIGKDGDRETVIAKYRTWLLHSFTTEDLFARLGQLDGRLLGCWCSEAEPCHGDVLIELAKLTESELLAKQEIVWAAGKPVRFLKTKYDKDGIQT